RPVRCQAPDGSLKAEKRADALDRVEIPVGGDRVDGAAVRERLVDGEVEAVVAGLHLSPVERAATPLDRDAPAGWALRGLVVDAVLVEEQLDARVRGGLGGPGQA